MRYFLLLLIPAIVGCNPSGESQSSDMPSEMMVHNGWVRAVDDVAGGSAAYFILHNGTANDLALIAVETEIAGRAELHESRMENGLLRMRPVEGIRIEANSAVELAPGGYHVMLMDLQHPLAAGDSVEVALHFDDGTILDEKLNVQGGASGHSHHH